MSYCELIERKSCSSAAKLLDASQRRQILNLIPDSGYFLAEMLVADLVENDLDIYVEILQDPRFEEYRYAPLRGLIDDGWVAKAKLALEHGLSINYIAGAVHGQAYSWVGKESDDWQYWFNQFDHICNSDDPDVRKIAQHGKAWASEHRDMARKREREWAIFGED
jgi:hypothetical protein